jgi:hypothetical protein
MSRAFKLRKEGAETQDQKEKKVFLLPDAEGSATDRPLDPLSELSSSGGRKGPKTGRRRRVFPFLTLKRRLPAGLLSH